MTRPKMQPRGKMKARNPEPAPAPQPKPRKPKRRVVPLAPLSERGRQWLNDVRAEVGSLKHSLADHFVSLERALRIEESLQAELEIAVFQEDENGHLRVN